MAKQVGWIMKKVLLITVCVFGLGVAGFAGPFSGSWATDVTVITPQTPTFTLTSVLTVNYTISGWTFGSVSRFSTAAGWHQQDFSADGAIGVFTVTNDLRFVPTTPAFTFLRSTAAVPIAGVDLSSRFLIVESGSGFRLGFSAPVEDEELRFAATAYFGSFKFDTAWGLVPVADRSHIPEFRGLDIDITMPFYSTTLTIDIDFVTGFQDITFDVPAFPLGIPGFTLDLKVVYTLTEKTVTITPGIALVDWVHFEPVVSIVRDAYVITGLRLDGLRFMWAVTDAVRFRYLWDAHPGGPSIVPGGYRQMVELQYKETPITLTMAGRWSDLTRMFPDRIDIDLALDLLPGFAVDFGVEFRTTAFHALSFGFTVTW